MSEPRSRLLLGLSLCTALGCAGASLPQAVKPAEKPPAAKPEEKSPAAPEPTPAAKPADPAPTEAQPASSSPATEVLDPGGASVTLAEAARAEKTRRATAGEPVAVITDKTLPHLPKGQITYADASRSKKRAVAAVKPDDDSSPARAEQYWRGRALDIRLRWKAAADKVKELEKSANGWRRTFYAEADPYVRDGQVKPEWDRVLDRLGEARAEVTVTKKELEDFLEEGRRAGAMPGWLREGAEKEPVEKPKSKDLPTVDPKEPPVVREDGT